MRRPRGETSPAVPAAQKSRLGKAPSPWPESRGGPPDLSGDPAEPVSREARRKEFSLASRSPNKNGQARGACPFCGTVFSFRSACPFSPFRGEEDAAEGKSRRGEEETDLFGVLFCVIRT